MKKPHGRKKRKRTWLGPFSGGGCRGGSLVVFKKGILKKREKKDNRKRSKSPTDSFHRRAPPPLKAETIRQKKRVVRGKDLRQERGLPR